MVEFLLNILTLIYKSEMKITLTLSKKRLKFYVPMTNPKNDRSNSIELK